VASKLPVTCFEQMCQDSLQLKVSQLNSETNPDRDPLAIAQIEIALSGKELDFNKKTNYYRLFWQSYLDNELLLSELQSVSNENFDACKRIYNIEDYYENKLVPRLVSFPN
jgi:hypothetical protein